VADTVFTVYSISDITYVIVLSEHNIIIISLRKFYLMQHQLRYNFQMILYNVVLISPFQASDTVVKTIFTTIYPDMVGSSVRGSIIYHGELDDPRGALDARLGECRMLWYLIYCY